MLGMLSNLIQKDLDLLTSRFLIITPPHTHFLSTTAAPNLAPPTSCPAEWFHPLPCSLSVDLDVSGFVRDSPLTADVVQMQFDDSAAVGGVPQSYSQP